MSPLIRCAVTVSHPAARCAKALSVAFLVLLASVAPRAGAEEAWVLGPTEALLLVRLDRLDLMHETRMGAVTRLRFGRVGSSDAVQVTRRLGLQVLRVPAGRYFMLGAESGHPDRVPLVFEQPREPTLTLDVPAGTAVYVGDYVFDEGGMLRHTYTHASKRAAARMDTLSGIPLQVARAGVPNEAIVRD